MPLVIPPVLAQPSLRALGRGLGAIVRPAAYSGGVLREAGSLFSGSAVVAFASGRAALAAAILTAVRATGRPRVLLPAFSSYSVLAAAVSTGASVGFFDIDPHTLGPDPGSLRAVMDETVAAVVFGSLFGFPDPGTELAFVGSRGALAIDDAAQALGATDHGQAVGGRGDLGVLSFGRGKCVTTGDGGVLLVHDPALAPHVVFPTGRPARGMRCWALAAGVRLAAVPQFFHLLSRLPTLGVGMSRYDPTIDLRPAPSAVDGLVAGLGKVVRGAMIERQRVAAAWGSALAEVPGVQGVRARIYAEPAWLRYPLLADSPETRTIAVRALASVGLCYVRSYPETLPDLGVVGTAPGPWPGATCIAARILALPCHLGVSDALVARAATKIRVSIQEWSADA